MPKSSTKRYSRRRSSRMKKKSMKTYRKIAYNAITRISEKKYFDYNVSGTVDYTGTVIKVSTVTQGSADQQRVGDQLLITSIRLKYLFNIADTYNMLRIILFKWLPDDAIDPPTVTKIIFYNNSANAPLAPYNMDVVRQRKHRIYYDKLHVLESGRPTQIGGKRVYKNSRISFTANGTGGTGHIYVLLISDSSAANHPGYQFDVKTTYIDS